jgi:hypothetical protein
MRTLRASPVVDLNPQQLDCLRHMLGINRPDLDRPEPYRDYACANPGDPLFVDLARLGAVRMYSKRYGYEWFQCTDEGRAAAIASYKTIQHSAAKRRYIRFLSLRDCCPDLTFHEFLVNPIYRAYPQHGAGPK